MAGADDDDLAEVVALERALLDPRVRGDRARVEALLHPGFAEFGASGRHWDRAGIIDMLAGEPRTDGPVAVVDRIDAVRLAGDVVHLTYTSRRPDGEFRRSALWRRVDGRWLLYFHQGTPVPRS